MEGPRVRQEIDAFPHRQLAAAVLERDAVRAAHLLGHAALPFDLLDVVVPVHSVLRIRIGRDSLIRVGVGVST